MCAGSSCADNRYLLSWWSSPVAWWRDYSVRSQPAGEELELLRRHAPRLVFDAVEAPRPTRVEA